MVYIILVLQQVPDLCQTKHRQVLVWEAMAVLWAVGQEAMYWALLPAENYMLLTT